VWLLQLGIRIEIIAPRKPQQNGRLERLHRTLKAEVATPARANRREQQRAFDLWRREYNQERPHEALGQRRPAAVYTPSLRRYPRPLVQVPVAPFSDVVRLDKNGFLKWHQRRVFISALAHEYIELDDRADGRWDVHWGAIPLGSLHEHRLDRGLIVPRRPRGTKKVSGMSLL
jgi:hypothetical protein